MKTAQRFLIIFIVAAILVSTYLFGIAWGRDHPAGVRAPAANGQVFTSIEAPGNVVTYVGGDFTRLGDQNRNRLASYSVKTGNVTAFDPNVNGRVETIEIRNNVIYIGGLFNAVNGVERNGWAALNDQGQLLSWTADPPGRV